MARNFAGGTDSIRYGAANAMTTGCIAFWMKTTQATVNAVPVSCWSGSSRTGCGFILNNTANKLLVQCYDGTAARVNLVSSASVNTGSWVHVAFNFNTGNGSSQQLYINGSLDNSTTASAAWSFASTTYVFGDTIDAFWPTYNGDLAEHGIWLRNLTADEIAALAKGFSPRCIGGVQGYHPLVRDEYNRRDSFFGSTTGTTVTDHPRIMGGLT